MSTTSQNILPSVSDHKSVQKVSEYSKKTSSILNPRKWDTPENMYNFTFTLKYFVQLISSEHIPYENIQILVYIRIPKKPSALDIFLIIGLILTQKFAALFRSILNRRFAKLIWLVSDRHVYRLTYGQTNSFYLGKYHAKYPSGIVRKVFSKHIIYKKVN